MEVLETDAARADFDRIPLGPVGFQVNMLRSASGSAFIAFCEAPVREAILETLRRSDRKGDRLARLPERVAAIRAETRAQGFGLSDPDFWWPLRRRPQHARRWPRKPSLPIRLGPHVPGTLNITWTRRALPPARAGPTCPEGTGGGGRDRQAQGALRFTC